MAKRSQLSFTDYRMTTGRGGPRKGAGRKPSGRNCDPKRRREAFSRWTPAHITLRVRDGIPSLRKPALLAELRNRFAEGCERPGFRLVHYSVQNNHLHLIVEASDQQALGRGMMSLGVRIARAIQRIFDLKGRILSGAYHVHLLRSLSEAKHQDGTSSNATIADGGIAVA